MTNRDRIMILTVLCVAAIGGFWMFILKPQRVEAADARAQLATARQSLESARAQVDSGRRARDDYQRDRATMVKLGRVVPPSDDIPTLLTQLEALAEKEDVKFTSYALSEASGDSASATAATDQAAPEQSTAAAPGSADGGADSSTQAVAPLYPPGSSQIAGGIGRTAITIELVGSYFDLERYLRAVQRFAIVSERRTETRGRLMIVDGFSYATAVNYGKFKGGKLVTERKLKAELSASVYFAPAVEAPSAGGPTAAEAAGTTSPGTAAFGGSR